MNNETSSIYASVYSQIVSEDTTNAQTFLAALSLLFYASCLHFPDEVRYIWKPKLTLSAFLYLLAQYALTLLLISTSIQNGLPASVDSLHVCNSLGILNGVLQGCGYIGVQGLIALRTHSICRGYPPMAIALSILFLVSLGLAIYAFTIPDCTDTNLIPVKLTILAFVHNIFNIVLDGLAFIGIIHQVWKIWKLKQGLGKQSNGKDLVTSLLQQGFLRFFFVLFITSISTILGIVQPTGTAVDIFATFQNVLSCIMLCEFTIALRRRNMNRSIPNQSALNLPTLSIPSQDDSGQPHQSILGRIHESLIAEMAEGGPAVIDNPRDIELDDVQDVNPTTAI